jgi:hypothetical protein
MGRPLKTRKYNEAADVPVDYGYPTGANNDFDTNEPGVVGGWPEVSEQVEITSVFLEQVGAGTITANTTSAVVTGVGTRFDQAGSIGGATIYNSAGVQLGVVDSVANATSLTFVANCAANITAGSFTFAEVDNGYIIRQKGKKKFLVARKH